MKKGNPPSTERRTHPRFQFVKTIALIVECKKISGCAYDISQGGISFVAESLPATGPVTMIITESGFTYSGRLLRSSGAGKPGLFRYQMQFDKPLTTEELAGILKTVREVSRNQ